MSVCRSFVVLPSKDGMDDKGSFNNYVDKKRGLGVSGKSTLGHVTKGRLDSM